MKVYGKNGNIRGENCRKCSHTEECEFYTDISKNEFTTKYFTAVENVDGYNKDSCVFAEDIDIYDTMSVNVKYKNGALLTYSLIAHAPIQIPTKSAGTTRLVISAITMVSTGGSTAIQLPAACGAASVAYATLLKIKI